MIADDSTPTVIALDGAHNFREVGGYPAREGLRLRRGLLWRSAGLDRLSSRDCSTVQALGIQTIADLRGERERERFPTVVALASTVRTLSGPGGPSAAAWSTPDIKAWSDMTAMELREEIARLYTGIAEAHADQFACLFAAIAEGCLPVLIHCTAGKDRTGLAVALLLELLGVPREWVLWDYEQTNHHLRKDLVHLESAVGVGGLAEWMEALGPESRDVMLGVDRAYLVAALTSLEREFGSVEAFAADRLALSPTVLAGLRTQLLEAA
ncbi:MAG: tyrosine-protein phosphatase [Reyranella sp.]|nr:tyrosine-protein phosphatase [Reyranella sp.]